MTASEGRSQTVRVPTQGSREWGKPSGSIEWWEHVEAWRKGYGYDQSATRLAERGGFSYAEIVYGLGHEPTTWAPEHASWRGCPDDPGPKSLGEDSAARAFYEANSRRLRPSSAAASRQTPPSTP